MKAILILFDSLNRRALSPYGNDWVEAPNFQRLAERSITFDNYYAGSMPCMPARRELHTGRHNFLHRSWGPLEPFDDSMPQLLKENGIYTHLSTDHHHYFEDGGCTYHSRYNTWFFARGQEGDNWKAEVNDPDIPDSIRRARNAMWQQDWINRKYIVEEADFPQARVFENSLEFIRTNHQDENWFLQIESFDPHEPFHTSQQFKDLYPHDYNGPHFDWPDYAMVTETPDQVQHANYEYAALVSRCDHYLGKVLDAMDEYALWDDTMLIVLTDHGFLLGEHGFWAKNIQPLYSELAQIPLFIWDPRSCVRDQRRQSLVQLIDITATLLEYFGVEAPSDVQGAPLRQTIIDDTPVREAVLFGYHGCHVNVTDGRYVYMRGPAQPDNQPLFEYTLMPTHLKHRFTIEELEHVELAAPYTFTKGCKILRVRGPSYEGILNPFLWGTLLFDLESDPQQERPLNDVTLERRMIELLLGLMAWNDAPADQYVRLGLPQDGVIGDEHLALGRIIDQRDRVGSWEVEWQGKGKKMYYTLLCAMPFHVQQRLTTFLESEFQSRQLSRPDEDEVLDAIVRFGAVGGIGIPMSHAELVKERI